MLKYAEDFGFTSSINFKNRKKAEYFFFEAV